MLIIDEIHNCMTGSAKLIHRNGLRYFHQLPYIDALKIKTEMITEIEDGFTVVLNGQYYWLPKTQ
ncbi:transposase, partial [Acinetobacter baumannii]